MLAVVFALAVVVPVGVEVAVVDDGAQQQDRLDSGQGPPGAGDIEPVLDQVAAASFGDAGGDWPAQGEAMS